MSDLARLELPTLRLPWVTADPLPHVDTPYICFRASAAMSGCLPTAVVIWLAAAVGNPNLPLAHMHQTPTLAS